MMMDRRGRRVGREVLMRTLLIAFAIVALPLAAVAQTYEWIDEQGRRNFTDNLNRVPEKYRSSATRLDSMNATRDAIRRDAERRYREDLEDERRARQRAAEDAARDAAAKFQDQQRAADDHVARYNRAASACAQHARVDIAIKPDTRLEILGTARQRFAFTKCMAESGYPTERY